MSDSSVFNMLPSALGERLAAGDNGTTLYKADLLQGERSFQVVTVGRAWLLLACFKHYTACFAGCSEEVMH